MSRTRQIRKWLVRCGVGGLLTILLGEVFLGSITLRSKLVDPSYDLPFLKRPVVKPTEVVMVWMDEESHRDLGQPFNTSWDRGLHAQLVERLTLEGARAVVFDVIFTDPHPTKPEGDARFAKAIKANGKVVLGADFKFTPEGAPTIYRSMYAFYDAAAANGIVQLATDEDFIVRRHLHVPPNKDADSFSSLTWEAA